MFRVKRVFGGRTLLGAFIAVGAIALLFASYLVGANIGHAQTTNNQNTTRASIAGSGRTAQSPTATPTTVPTTSGNTVFVVVTPTTVPTTPSNTVVATSTPTVSTTTNTAPPTNTPTATPVDTANSSIDQLPADLSYECNRVEYLGGKWPVHLYVGGCLVNEINQYSWAIDSIKNVLNSTVCAANQVCVIAVDVTAYFLHNEIHHIVAESNKCGGNGIYVHVFGAFFRTHPVC
jgi:hypothetical protein